MALPPVELSFLDALNARYGSEDDLHTYDDAALLVGDPSRRRNKKWELVGMEETRRKQARFDRLVHVVLRGSGMTVAVKAAEKRRAAVVNPEGGEAPSAEPSADAMDDLASAKMHRLEELDISENVDLPLTEVGRLVTYFPSLTTLQASDIPCLLSTPSATPILIAPTLTKLVLHAVGLRSLYQLRTLVDLPKLTELHLDRNDLDTIRLFATAEEAAACRSASVQQGAKGEEGSVVETTDWLCFPLVATLSLAHNKLSSWGIEEEARVAEDGPIGLAHTLPRVFPRLKTLFLTDNLLPDLPTQEVAPTVRDSPSPYAFLYPLEWLCLNDNPRITDPSTVDAVRVLCPHLQVFRITYHTLLPLWNDTLSRMYVVASLPTITTLNRGQVRAKERLDSEMFYVQRGLAERERQQATLNGAPAALPDRVPQLIHQEPPYPLLDVLREKYKDVIISIYREGSSATTDGSAHIMLHITLVCENAYNSEALSRGPPGEAGSGHLTHKVLPSSLTIAKLKALVRVAFQIDPMHQKLHYFTGDAAVPQLPTELDNDMQTLAYYGVGDGGIIRVTDTSLR